MNKLSYKYINEMEKLNKQLNDTIITVCDTSPCRYGIPLHVFQTYKKDMPQSVKNGVLALRNQNPDFCFYLYTDDAMEHFIKESFDMNVYNAFSRLKPMAYKSDLFRYCVLYKYGGIYMDIKLQMAGNNDLLSFLGETKYHVLDETNYTRNHKHFGGFIYQGFLVSKPNDPFYKDLIDTIVKHSETNFIGKNPLDITGPNMYWRVLQKHKSPVDDCETFTHKGYANIYYKGKSYVKGHDLNKYYADMGNKNRYYNMWPNNVYM